MKKIYSFILVILASCIARNVAAQVYHPMPVDSSSWKMARCFYFFPDSVHTELYAKIPGNDTLLHGNMYKNIYLTVHAGVYSANDTTYSYLYGALREVDKKIYIVNYNCGDSIEHLIYDFNYNTVGDTIYTQKDAINCDTTFYPHIIMGIDSVLVGTHYNRRLHVADTNNLHEEYWTEGVGSNYGLIYATHWETDNSYDLICLTVDDTIKYVNPTPNYNFCTNHPTVLCDSVPVIVPEGIAELQAKGDYHVFPNPSTDGQQVIISIDHIVSSGLRVDLINAMGQTLKHVNLAGLVNSYKLDIGSLPGGLYFLSIQEPSKPSVKLKLIRM